MQRGERTRQRSLRDQITVRNLTRSEISLCFFYAIFNEMLQKKRMKEIGREGEREEERKKKIETKVAQHIFYFYVHKKDKP